MRWFESAHYPTRFACIVAICICVLCTGCDDRSRHNAQQPHSAAHVQNSVGPTTSSAAPFSSAAEHLPKPTSKPPTEPPLAQEGHRTAAGASENHSLCPNGMVYMPGGEYTRTAIQGPIKIRALCIDRYEVTAGEYEDCVVRRSCPTLNIPSANGCNWRKMGRGRHPMNCVPWQAAVKYCSSRNARLPMFTELFWAVHNGAADTDFPWGNEPPNDTTTCWKRLGLGFDYGTCEVGSHATDVTRNGIYDLAGNVGEWTLEQGRRRIEKLVALGDYATDNASLLSGEISDADAASQTTTSVGFRCVQPKAK